MTLSLRRAFTAALLMLGIVAAPAGAAPFSVGSGALDWKMANVYNTPCGTTLQCTFLGFTTNPSANPGSSNGTATTTAPATGGPVNGASERGVDKFFTFSYPGKATGTYDPATKVGALEYDGTVAFSSSALNFNITIDDPRITLNGTSGQLLASGTNHAGTAYNRSVFDLDLTGATYTQVGGTVTIANVVVKIAEGGTVFFPNYATGAGPEREPDTFGSLTLTVRATPPAVTVTPKDSITSGQVVTVSGTGASKSTQGLYVMFAPTDAAYTDQTVVANPPAFQFLGQSAISASGDFSTTVTLSNVFTPTNQPAYSCELTKCAVKTIAAHFAADRSQDTKTPVTFAAPVATATPTVTPVPTYVIPTVTPTPTPGDYNPPTAKAKISKIKLTRSRLKFTLSKKARVKGTIKRKRGKTFKTMRMVDILGKKGANSRKVGKKLKPGRYKVTLKPGKGKTKTKTVRLRKVKK